MKPEQILAKIKKLGEEIEEQVEKGKNPHIVMRAKGIGNVNFDEKNKLLTMGDKQMARSFLNIAHARKFMQTVMIANLCRRLVEADKHASIRELYYQLKHTIDKTKENTFEGQEESDPIIEDLERTLDVLREQMNLTADRRGYLYGNIKIIDAGDTINCAKLGRGGYGIPSTVEELEFEDVKADFALVIETAAMYERLVEEQFAKKHNAILVATQGQAARGVRRLIHRLNEEAKLPVIVFSVDGEETVVLEEDGMIKNVQLKELMNGRKTVRINGVIENERAQLKAKSMSFDDKTTTFEDVKQVIRHPIIEDLYEVTTDLGYSVKVTKSHSLIVYDSKRHLFAEKTPPAVDIENDFAVTSLDIPNNEKLRCLDLGYLVIGNPGAEVDGGKIVNKKNKASIPRFIRGPRLTEFCRLLGYYAAEGHADKNRVVFSFNQKERAYIGDVKGISKSVFGISAIEANPHATETQVMINNRLIAAIFKNLASTGAPNKRVPDIVFNVPVKMKKEFLKGYFRGDGRVDLKKDKSSVELWAKTVSKKLAYDLVLLISQIGANATIQYPKEDYGGHELEMRTGSGKRKSIISARHKPYLVSVANKEALLNLRDIVSEFNPRALKHMDGDYIKTPKLDSLPREFVGRFRENLRKELRGKLENELPPSTFQWPRISKKKLRNLLGGKRLGSELQILKDFAESKTTLARITKIEKVKPKDGYVYDLEMGGAHRFFSNFICVHNTDGDPYGYYIYSVIKMGSINLAYLSTDLGTPKCKFIGMTMTDIGKYGLEKVTEKLKDLDIKRLKEEMEYPWFQDRHWQTELKKMLKGGVRIEQQALANKSLEFVAKKYLPEKIQRQEFLP